MIREPGGLSNHGILQLEAAGRIGTVDAIQPPFNVIHRDAADDVLLRAREHEAGVIVYSPMEAPRLSGIAHASAPGSAGPGSGTRRHRLSGGCQVADHDFQVAGQD